MNRKNLVFLLLVLPIVFCSFAVIGMNSFYFPEKIKQDLIDYQKRNEIIIIDENIINSLGEHQIIFYQIGEKGIAHLKYKNNYSIPSMKICPLMFYEQVKNEWELKHVLPYFYEFEILDSNNLIFLSNNKFCNYQGKCIQYLEINRVVNNEIELLHSFTGYNNEIYVKSYLPSKEQQDDKFQTGDTIISQFNIAFEEINEEAIVFSKSHRLGVIEQSGEIEIQVNSEQIFNKMEQ